MILAAALLAAAQPAAPRTAFFCQVADRSDTRGAEALRPLSILLSGTDDTVGEGEPIETFDPTGLLGGRRFMRFIRNPGGDGLAIVSGAAGETDAALLSLVELEGPRLGAGFGLLREGTQPRFLGQCIRYRSEDTAADFHSFNASLGSR